MIITDSGSKLKHPKQWLKIKYSVHGELARFSDSFKISNWLLYKPVCTISPGLHILRLLRNMFSALVLGFSIRWFLRIEPFLQSQVEISSLFCLSRVRHDRSPPPQHCKDKVGIPLFLNVCGLRIKIDQLHASAKLALYLVKTCSCRQYLDIFKKELRNHIWRQEQGVIYVVFK